jgi:hypothetical protein
VISTQRNSASKTADQILTIESGDGRASVMAFSPDGSRLFAGCERGVGIIWDVRREHGAPKPKEREAALGGSGKHSRRLT